MVPQRKSKLSLQLDVATPFVTGKSRGVKDRRRIAIHRMRGDHQDILRHSTAIIVSFCDTKEVARLYRERGGSNGLALSEAVVEWRTLDRYDLVAVVRKITFVFFRTLTSVS
jgi:hypothetical protein